MPGVFDIDQCVCSRTVDLRYSTWSVWKQHRLVREAAADTCCATDQLLIKSLQKMSVRGCFFGHFVGKFMTLWSLPEGFETDYFYVWPSQHNYLYLYYIYIYIYIIYTYFMFTRHTTQTTSPHTYHPHTYHPRTACTAHSNACSCAQYCMCACIHACYI